jgi:hypothetical protein
MGGFAAIGILLMGFLVSNKADLTQILRAVEDSEYEFSWHPDRQAHFVPNRAQNLRFKFEGASFSVEQRVRSQQSAHWTATFKLQGFGNGVEQQITPVTFEHNKNLATVRAGRINILYENTRDGLRQSFEINQRHPGNQPLQLRFHVDTTFLTMVVDEASNAVLLYGSPGVVLSYDDLNVFDATGRRLEAQINQSGPNGFFIFVNDDDATYPILVDPLTSVKTYSESQSGAKFGTALTSGHFQSTTHENGGVVVGAPEFDNGANANVGKVFHYNAGSGSLPTSPTWTKLGENAGDQFGFSVAKGKFNGDLYDDLAVGAPYFDNQTSSDAGKVYVFYGASTGLPSSPSWTGLPVSAADPAGANAGWSLTAVNLDDALADDYHDLAIGAPGFDVLDGLDYDWDVGKVFVYYGTSSASGLQTTVGWSYTGPIDSIGTVGAQVGYSLTAIADVNDSLEQHSTLVVGAPFKNQGVANTTYGAVLFFEPGGSGMPSSPTQTLWGNHHYGWFGFSVASFDNGRLDEKLSDIDGDGYNDLVVGAPAFSNGQTEEGKIYVYDNSGSSFSTTPWFTMESNQAGARFGYSVACGDLDGDNYADVFVGAPLWNTALHTDAGKASFLKSNGSTLTETETQLGLSANARIGWSVAFGRYVEGNGPSAGINGFIVGAPHDSGGTVSIWKY